MHWAFAGSQAATSRSPLDRFKLAVTANKERESLALWVEKNPNWMETEATQLEYLTIVRNVCEPIENEDKNGKKIIHNISLNVFVDKGL